jgi:steroid delta-isomerase
VNYKRNRARRRWRHAGARQKFRGDDQLGPPFPPYLATAIGAEIEADVRVERNTLTFNQPFSGKKVERMRNQCLLLKKMMTLATAMMFLFVTGVMRVEAAGNYDLTPAEIEAAVEEYFASVGSLDVQRFMNNFAPDGVLEDPVGTPPLQGAQAIAAYFGAIIAPFSEIKPYIQEVVVCGQEAAVNWKLRLKTKAGKVIFIDGMGVFKFNQQGKLQSVREFWDLAAFLAQLQG